jgi:hypothetical protein
MQGGGAVVADKTNKRGNRRWRQVSADAERRRWWKRRSPWRTFTYLALHGICGAKNSLGAAVAVMSRWRAGQASTSISNRSSSRVWSKSKICWGGPRTRRADAKNTGTRSTGPPVCGTASDSSSVARDARPITRQKEGATVLSANGGMIRVRPTPRSVSGDRAQHSLPSARRSCTDVRS